MTRILIALGVVLALAPTAAADPLDTVGVVYDEVDATVRHHADAADGAAERNATGARNDADAFARPRTGACHPVTTAYADDRYGRGRQGAARVEDAAVDAARYAGSVLRGERDPPNASRVVESALDEAWRAATDSEWEPPAAWDEDPRLVVGRELLALQAVTMEVQRSGVCVLDAFAFPANATADRAVHRDAPAAIAVADAAAERAGAPSGAAAAYAEAAAFADLVLVGVGVDPYGPLPRPPDATGGAYEPFCTAVATVWACETEGGDGGE